MSTIQKPSSLVVRDPLTAEQTLGKIVTAALGETGSNIVSRALNEIPEHLEGIDKELDPFLVELISGLQKLGEDWKIRAAPDQHHLSSVIKLLTQFKERKDREQLLYPQIMQAKPTSTSNADIEIKDIVRKKSEAEEKTRQLLNTQVLPLLNCLETYQNPSFSNKASSEKSLKLIGQLEMKFFGRRSQLCSKKSNGKS